MTIVLWSFQILLACLFLVSGVAKSVMSRERMRATGQTGAAAMPLKFIRFIALCEVLGAIGIILPSILSIQPVLVPLAAAGLAIIMVGAAVVHYRLHDWRPILINIVLLGMCLTIVFERL
ncbi:MAG: DoxX family protein [Terracidiphilus sp.]|jgi:uncharacterized membrane protein YphA (DoxX/SURF4 family)